jgi:uncharacterized repeat protein (TIGR01451 family)
VGTKRRVLPIAWIVLAVGVPCFSLFFLLRASQARPASELHVCPNGCAYASVQAAVDVAHEGDVIKVAAGVYTDVEGRLAPAGYLGPAVITQVVCLSKTITLEGGYTTTNWTTSYPLTQPTTLDAQDQGRVFFIIGAISPTIQSLRITGGNANGLGGYSQMWYPSLDCGGGVYIITATATLSGNWILSNTGNTVAFFGGGLCLIGSNALLTANTISANSAALGGGLNIIYGHATLIGNTIAANHSRWGGGLYLADDDTTLIGNTISSNTASPYECGGGGLTLINSRATLIENNIISNATDGDGGGLSLSGALTLQRNTIMSNTAFAGGGLYFEGGEATLEGNMIASNTARRNPPFWVSGSGGGLYLDSGNASLDSNTIISNMTDGFGGGLVVFGNAALANNIIAGNQAGETGSALDIGSSISLRSVHTTIAGNTGGDGRGIYVAGSGDTVILTDTILVGHPIGISVDAGSTATLEATLWGAGAWANTTDWEGGGTIITGTRNYWGNPGFINPNAGNYHRGPDSAAIDMGVDAGVTTDRDGVSRPQGNGFDLGAYEYVPLIGLSRSEKSVSPDTAAAGEMLTYTLVLRNDGITTPTDTLLVDALPTATTFISGSEQVTSGVLTATSGLLSWAVTLAPDVPVTATYSVILNESIPVQNTAVVTDRTGASVTLSAWVNARRVYLPVLAGSFQRQSAPIVFSTDREGNRDIYTLNVDTLEQTRLTDNNAVDESPSWSPDGSRIAFMSERDGNREIYVMQADGSGQTNLTQHAGQDTSPAWSPNGNKIVFVSDRDGNREIYVMNADGSGQTRLTNDPAQDDMPAWSPDGESIAFSSNRDGHYQIYLMRPDGSGLTHLTHNAADDLFPAWSPDGQRIAFDSNRDGNRNIYVMNADGSGQARLTDGPADEGDPSWSPDGQWIAFASQRSGNWEIYMMNADGSHLTRLTFSWDTNWAPDW